MCVSLFSRVCRPVAGVVNLCPRLAVEQDIDNIVLTVAHELTHALVCVCMCASMHVDMCCVLCTCVYVNGEVNSPSC